MDISLSFNITNIGVFRSPALFIASKARPPVIDPSPMMETTLKSFLVNFLDSATPIAAEIDVDACPAPNTSYSLSFLFKKPLRPPICLIDGKSLYLPVKSL